MYKLFALFLCEITIKMGVVKVHPLTDVMAERYGER